MSTDIEHPARSRFAATKDDHDDGDWADVLRRRSRTGRRHALVAAVSIVAVVLPVAIAFGSDIRGVVLGTPAPPSVLRVFVQDNAMRVEMERWVREHGGDQRLVPPSVDAASARGEIAVSTSDGPLYLWSAAARDGRLCWFVDFASDQRSTRASGSGTCETRRPSGRKILSGYGWSNAHPTLEVLDGRVSVAASAVVVHFRDRSAVRVPVIDRFFLAAFPRVTTTPTEIQAIDSKGRVVADTSH